MRSWDWLDGILREAGLDLQMVRWPQNKTEIDQVVREYLNEQARCGRCSLDWEKAGGQILADDEMRQELTKRLRLLFLKWIDHFEYKKRFAARNKLRQS
jgi:hypothetical protein